MADDPVAAARQDVLEWMEDERRSRLQAFTACVDALIAAVRAEQGVERFVDGIIAAVVPKTLDKAGLTDAEVDAFLAAVDEHDPERVERIRKLFLDKLKLGQE